MGIPVKMDAFFSERGFGQKLGFGKAPALLVIDLMRAFTDENHPLGSRLDAEIEQVRRLLTAARETSTPIFYTVVEYDEPGAADGGLWVRKMKGSLTLLAGSPHVQLDPRLERRPEEPIIVKKYASCFFGTDLASRLVSRGIDTLILTGATTSGCVRATAVDAIQLGFRPIVAADAVADRSEAAHRQSLFDLEAKYADVLSVDEILPYLRGRLTQSKA